MPIINNRNTTEIYSTNIDLTKRIFIYCIPRMLLSIIIPFIVIILSLIIRAIGIVSIAEFILNYIAIPLFIIAAIIININTTDIIKRSFPRPKMDAHRVLTSIFISSLLSVAVLVLTVLISVSVYGVFPYDFPVASYLRDMMYISPYAITIFYITLFVFIFTISCMATTSYFIGHKRKNKFNFTQSCLVFLIIYIIVLIFFIVSYFAATFIDIIALENIQIANTIFNSSILCSFVTFDVIALPCNLILYFILYNRLTNTKKELHHF